MCLRPVTLSHDIKNPFFYGYVKNYLGRWDPSNLQSLLVPCGHCEECTKTRQNQHAYKLYQRISGLNYCFHITLTYRTDSLPFSSCYNFINSDSGETFRFSDPEPVTDPRALESLRDWYHEQDKSSKPVYFYSQEFKMDENFIQAVFTPSLQRSDVRKALKVCRILYQRQYGCKMPDFVYSFCGEYGPRKCRPHYHLVLASKYDVTDAVNFFSNYWQVKYGFTVVKKVNKVNDNNTDGYELVSRYLSKYMSKGSFECQSVLDGYAEKGRICQSLGMDPRLNTDVFEQELIPYFRAYNLFGEYDPITFRLKSSGKKLSSAQLESICDEIIKRSYVSIGLSKVSIPRYLKEAVFYFKNVNGKLRSACYHLSREEKDLKSLHPELFSSKALRSPLSYLVSYRFQELQAKDRDKELQQIKQRGAETFCANIRSSIQLRADRIEKAYKAFLSGSFSSQ